MRTWIALAAATVLVTGVAATSNGPGVAAPTTAGSHGAGDVVPAGHTAYVVGWNPDNSGALWHVNTHGSLSPRTPPPGLPGNPGLDAPSGLVHVAFSSAHDGLAITGTVGSGRQRGHADLFTTDDGARTWTQVKLPTAEPPFQIAMAGGSAYVLTTNCLATKAPCNHATLWSVDPTGQSAPHSFNSLPAKTHTAGPITVAAYGADVWVLLNMGGGLATALHSVDSGQSWHRFKTESCLADPLVATSADVLWGRCVTGMEQHFTRQSGSADPVDIFSTDLAGTSNSDLIPLTDATAYAIIAGSTTTHLAVTHDGGRTAEVVGAIPRAIARQDFRVVFVSQQVGYLVTVNDGMVYRTKDSGRTWHPVT